jgi:cell wall-associated NlpC family hydrolase
MVSRITGPRGACRLGPLDPREHAWRDDLADVALAGLVAVPNYVRPVPMRVAMLRTPLLVAPETTAEAASELLLGERFDVLEMGEGFAWGQAADRYVGYVTAGALATNDGDDRVTVGPGDGLLFADARVKAPVLAEVPMGACLLVAAVDDRFLAVTSGPYAGAFLHRRHAEGGRAADWVAVAESFRGAPYRWGGRTRAGVDCSGLIQVSRQASGRPTRRDSDMQAADAVEVAPGDWRRGDIAWWPGHIGVLLAPDRLLHANGYWMACVVEPLTDVMARAVAGGGQGEPVVRRFADDDGA